MNIILFRAVYLQNCPLFLMFFYKGEHCDLKLHLKSHGLDTKVFKMEQNRSSVSLFMFRTETEPSS